MNVTELNSDELQQLKWNIYYNGEEEAFADRLIKSGYTKI